MESRARYIRPLAQIGGEVGGPDLDGTGGLSGEPLHGIRDRKSTRLNSSHSQISYAVFCLKKKNKQLTRIRPRVLALAALPSTAKRRGIVHPRHSRGRPNPAPDDLLHAHDSGV